MRQVLHNYIVYPVGLFIETHDILIFTKIQDLIHNDFHAHYIIVLLNCRTLNVLLEESMFLLMTQKHAIYFVSMNVWINERAIFCSIFLIILFIILLIINIFSQIFYKLVIKT